VDKFEPIVNDMSKTAVEEDMSPKVEVGQKEAPSAPLEPPAATEDASTDKADLSSLPSLDIDPSLPASIEEPTTDDKSGGGKERTGARAKHSMSSIDRRWRTIRRLALAGSLAGGAVGAWYLANKDEPGMQDPGSAWERFKNNFSELTDVSRAGSLAFSDVKANGRL
jgi:import inner membrane translocase subunit TIM50